MANYEEAILYEGQLLLETQEKVWWFFLKKNEKQYACCFFGGKLKKKVWVDQCFHERIKRCGNK